ncbi:hypothetical protein ACUN8C_14725 [Kushneria sp. Sum13]|uniref:hypothetical protein n=1 Tax=Kushneria sp. Sum13 TaxID=3459196 RepID=UPI0040459B13
MTFSKDQIVEYVYNSKPVMEFYGFAMATGFWPDFPDYQLEIIVWYLDAAEISDIEKIDEILVKHEGVLKEFVAHIYANRKTFWRVTPVFLCVLAIILRFPKPFTVEKLVQNGWDKDLATIVSTAANKFNERLI